MANKTKEQIKAELNQTKTKLKEMEDKLAAAEKKVEAAVSPATEPEPAGSVEPMTFFAKQHSAKFSATAIVQSEGGKPMSTAKIISWPEGSNFYTTSDPFEQKYLLGCAAMKRGDISVQEGIVQAQDGMAKVGPPGYVAGPMTSADLAPGEVQTSKHLAGADSK